MCSEVGGVQAVSAIFFSPSVPQWFFFFLFVMKMKIRVIESGAFCEN